MKVRVKVCCIQSLVEAQMAADAGADYLGLVGAMPSGPGPIADNLIAQIAADAPLPTVLLTSETTTNGVIDHVRRCNPSAVQLVDQVADGTYDALKAVFPALEVFQVIHATGFESVQEALSAKADYILLDSGRPQAREFGGTGRVHDWSVSAEIVRRSDRPVWLAGGLKPSNVAGAVQAVQPYGVDVCSGLREGGELEQSKLTSFIHTLSQC